MKINYVSSKIDNMLLFKKTTDENVVENDEQARISNKWKAFKQKIATYLQRKSDLLSIPAKRYSLIFFCLLFGGSSIAIMIHSATTKGEKVAITKISNPAHSIQDEKLYLQVDSAINKEEYERVEQFKNYLFQLKTDSAGRKKFDSIIHTRPRLIDSINLFEKMYLQQK